MTFMQNSTTHLQSQAGDDILKWCISHTKQFIFTYAHIYEPQSAATSVGFLSC